MGWTYESFVVTKSQLSTLLKPVEHNWTKDINIYWTKDIDVDRHFIKEK
jgi:hypothetical protein